MKTSRPSLLLLLILLLGVVLRFWHLDLKPVWADEVLTAIFSMGRNFADVPLNQIFSFPELAQVLTLQPEATCADITQTVSTQSVHPPLFFCWMHDWLMWTAALPVSWVWKLRALPALFGIVAIAAIYQLNRVAFSTTAGLLGATVMAVSPFAVYLSQEARHYTLPIVLVTLALLGLYQLHIDLYRQRFRPAIWLGWMAVNSIGFYIHYFFLLAFMAQAITLTANFLSMKYLPTLHPQAHLLQMRRSLTAITLAIGGVCLAYLPWLPTMVSHLSRPETDWLTPQSPDWLDLVAPLYRLPVGWILMVIALPVEKQPLWIAIPAVILMLVFTGWLLWQLAGRFGQLWSQPETHLPTRMLVVFILAVLLEFLAIVYLLGKDLTVVPRYNFIYFPAVCALLGACLAQTATVGRQKSGFKNRRVSGQPVVLVVILVGCISSLLVSTNFVFQKPYQPNQVAADMRIHPDTSLAVGMAYGDFQDVALGLSFALALGQPANQPASTTVTTLAFLQRSPDYGHVLQALAKLPQPLPLPLNFWFVAPGLRQVDFPPTLLLGQPSGTPATCTLERSHYHRRGVPYQLYQCR